MKGKRRAVRVVIGGTFNHMHRGHIALISKAFEIGDYVYIGLTTDRYAGSSRHGARVEGYATRRKAVKKLAAGFGKDFEIEPLRDRFGPAATGRFDAIVVSDETLPVAVEINRERRRNGLTRLSIVRVPTVLAADLVPISSSRIARGEIDSEGNLV